MCFTTERRSPFCHRGLVPAAAAAFALAWTPARAAEPVLEKTNLFQAGQDGYKLYRIPGIVATAKGTILAYCEARKNNSGDWGHIDVMLRRSADGGRTWEPPRKIVTPPADAQRNPAALRQNLGRPGEIVVAPPDPVNPSETAAVELADGRVMLNFRHESPNRLRGVVIGRDGATGWDVPRYDPQLPEPVCMGTLVRLSGPPAQAGSRILFANPHSTTGRRNLTVKLSRDEGQTWPVAKAIEPGTSGYCDLAVGSDGTIYCFYERGAAGNAYQPQSLCVARFNLAWLTEGKE